MEKLFLQTGCVDAGKKSTIKDNASIVKESLLMVSEKGTLISVWLKDAIKNDDGTVTATVIDNIGIEAKASVDSASAQYALALTGNPVSVTVRNAGTACCPIYEILDIDYAKNEYFLSVELQDIYDKAVGVLMPKLTAYPGTASTVAAAALLCISSLLLKAEDKNEQFDYEGGLLDRLDRTLSSVITVCGYYDNGALNKELLTAGTFFALLNNVYESSFKGISIYIPAAYKVLGLIDSIAETLGIDPECYEIRALKHIACASCDYASIMTQSEIAKAVKELSAVQLNVKSYLDTLPGYTMLSAVEYDD